MNLQPDQPLVIVTTTGQLEETLRRVMQQINPAPITDFTAEKMTVAQAAQYIGISYASLIKWIAEGYFRCHGTGRTRFLLRSELVEDYKKMTK
jgi:excisionase family DNA binding protein